MKNTATKILGATTGAALLVSATAAFAEPVNANMASDDRQVAWNHVEGRTSIQEEQTVAVPNPNGLFSFSQTAITPNWKIAQIFQKASNALCNASSELTVNAPDDWTITVTGDVANAYTATLGSFAADDEQTKIMGCSCASNMPGGGAVINAEVTGIPLAVIIEQAKPLAEVNTITLTSEDGYQMSLPYDYVMSRTSLLSYAINRESLINSVGGTNQLWIDSTAAKYFTRNVKEITLSTEENIPAVPGYENASDNQYVNRPNVGITDASF